jgi:hypothetical protein
MLRILINFVRDCYVKFLSCVPARVHADGGTCCSFVESNLKNLIVTKTFDFDAHINIWCAHSTVLSIVLNNCCRCRHTNVFL